MFINLLGTRINTDNILGYKKTESYSGCGIKFITTNEDADMYLGEWRSDEVDLILAYIDKALNVVKFVR